MSVKKITEYLKSVTGQCNSDFFLFSQGKGSNSFQSDTTKASLSPGKMKYVDQLLRKLITYIISICLFFQSYTYAQSTEETEQEIIEQFRDLQFNYMLSDYKLSQDPVENLMINLDMQMYQFSHGVKRALADSYHYIKENHDNPEVHKSPQYLQIANTAMKLNKFNKVKANLVDEGCLNSSSDKVRILSARTLQSSMSTINLEKCEQYSPELHRIDEKFIREIDQIITCFSDPGKEKECQVSESNEKGLFGYENDQKLRIIHGTLEHKKELDEGHLAILDYIFTQECNNNPDLCAQAKLKFPEIESQGVLALMNQRIKSLNAISRKEEESITRMHPKEQFAKTISELLRFISKTALKKCTPQIYEYLQKQSTKSKSNKNIELPYFKKLTQADISCMHQETKKLLEENGSKRQKKYRDAIRYIQIAQNKTPMQRARRGMVLHKSMDNTLHQMIVYDPIAFGSYLISDGSKEDLSNICATIKEVVKRFKSEDFAFNVFFSAVNISALFFIGAAIIFSGPISIAVLGISVTIAIADGFAYQVKQNKYEKKIKALDSIATQSRLIQRRNNEIAFEIFKREMDERLKYVDKRDSARFWKYFAFASASLGFVGTTLGVASKHLSHPVGGLSKIGKKLVEAVARGGRTGQKLANALVTIAKSGEKGMIDFVHALTKPNKFYNIIGLALASQRVTAVSTKLHNTFEIVEKAAKPVDRSSVGYWATSYSKATLNAMLMATKTAVNPKNVHSIREGLSYFESSYADLERYIHVER